MPYNDDLYNEEFYNPLDTEPSSSSPSPSSSSSESNSSETVTCDPDGDYSQIPTSASGDINFYPLEGLEEEDLCPEISGDETWEIRDIDGVVVATDNLSSGTDGWRVRNDGFGGFEMYAIEDAIYPTVVPGIYQVRVRDAESVCFSQCIEIISGLFSTTSSVSESSSELESSSESESSSSEEEGAAWWCVRSI